MTEDIKDLSSYFGNSSITIEMTQWKQEGRDYWMIFIPLEPHNQIQSCLQKVGDKVSRLDFTLIEVDGHLAFNDAVTHQEFNIDLSELSQSKIHMVGKHQKVTFLKEAIVNLGVSL